MRILLVHDCPLVRLGLRSFFSHQEDCEVIEARSSREDVMAMARKNHPDVVVLDGGLRSASPFELVQTLRQLQIQPIVVLGSPTAEEEELFQFLKYGAMAYVSCFLDEAELLATLRRVCSGEYMFTTDALAVSSQRCERLVHLRAMLLEEEAQNEAAAAAEAAKAAEEFLSARERLMLQLMARGASNAELAEATGVPAGGIKNRIASLYRKLQVSGRTMAVVLAVQKHWIMLELQEA